MWLLVRVSALLLVEWSVLGRNNLTHCKDGVESDPFTRGAIDGALCNGCKILNGVGFNPHPTRCDCWYRCLFRRNNVAYKSINCCGCGKFWNQELLTCMPADKQFCDTDPCSKANVTLRQYDDNCRAYWTCNGRQSSGTGCCQRGQIFRALSQRCEDDINGTCNDSCPCDTKNTSMNCSFLPNPADSHTYFVSVNNITSPILMSCPPGTSYNNDSCECNAIVIISEQYCPLDFDLRCTEIPLLDHGNRAYISNKGVTLRNGNRTCEFVSENRLTVLRYANFDWRDRFAIYSKFSGESNLNDNAPLVSNTDCAEPSSVELRLVRGPTGEPLVEAFIRTAGNETFNVRVPYKQSQVNEAYVSYDGTNLQLCVRHADGNVTRNNVNATGLVVPCKCAVQIGYGWTKRYFSGVIERTKIYIHCVPDKFCPS